MDVYERKTTSYEFKTEQKQAHFSNYKGSGPFIGPVHSY